LHLREAIERVFEGKAFSYALFYSYPGGLRFELAESGTSIHQFRTALNKSTEICEEVFRSAPGLVTCLRIRSLGNAFAERHVLRGLKRLGISIPTDREIWVELIDEDDWAHEGIPQYWLTIAFPTPLTLMESLLWSACATDFNIQPKADCNVYFMDLARGVMAHPYDDRGMDIVGPNHALLSEIFTTHRHYLLGYDMETMLATFAPDEAARG